MRYKRLFPIGSAEEKERMYEKMAKKSVRRLSVTPDSIRSLSISSKKTKPVNQSKSERAALKIQKWYRGFLGRRKYLDHSVYMYRLKYQAQFDSWDGLQRFRFQQIGACLMIQKWFRSRKYLCKAKWHKKYRRMMAKYKKQKIFFRAVIKSHIDFVQDDLDDSFKCQYAASIVIQRLMRGFLGRRRFKAYRTYTNNVLRMQNRAAVRIQSIARMYIAQVKYFPLGFRHRLFVKKTRKHFERLPLSLSVPLSSAPMVTSTVPKESGSLASSNIAGQIVQYPADFDPISHRKTVIYHTLRIEGLTDLDHLYEASLIVQRQIRKFNARCKYHKLYVQYQHHNATKLQKWVVKYLWRRKVNRALRVLQPFFGGIISIRKRTNQSASKITNAIRRYAKRKEIRKLLDLKRYCAKKLSVWCKRRLHIRSNIISIRMKRSLLELKNAGKLCYKQTELYWYSYYLWQGIKKTKQIEKAEHELQRIFVPMSLTNAVENSRILKMLRDCKGLFTSHFTANSLEIQFSKLKAGQERRMEYGKFLDLMAHLSVIRFLDKDPPKTLFEELAVFQQQKLSIDSMDPFMQRVALFRYGSLKGRPALISKFFDTFLTTLSEYPKVLEYLGRKSAHEQMLVTINNAVKILQSFVKNRWFITKTRKDLAERKLMKMERHRHLAASKIQKVIKGFLGRRLIKRLAQHLYSKYVDGETEREYWYNARTQMSFWTKPKLLGEFDCGMAVRMPTPDEMFSVVCMNCEKNHATCYCRQCNGPMCTPCYASVHRTGARKTHQHILIDNCIICDFQIGAKYCQTCKDLFCDSCFYYMHKVGRLRYHSYDRFTTACDNCPNRSARWKEHGQMPLTMEEVLALMSSSHLSKKASGKSSLFLRKFMSHHGTRGGDNAHTRYKIKNLCTVCYKKEYYEDPVARKASLDPVITAVDALPYFGREVKKFLEEQEILRAKEVVEENFKIRKAEMELRRKEKATVLIQRVYRGFRERNRVETFLNERKELMVLRKEEDAIRQSVLYNLKSIIGFKTLLASDTPLERVKKMYPWYMHHIVAECIENNWTEACRLQVQHEEYLKQNRIKANLLQFVRAELGVYFATRRYQQSVKLCADHEVLLDAALNIFYNAEASGAYAPPKLKQLKLACTKLQKQLQSDEKKRRQKELALDEAEEHLMRIIGPKGLQNLIKQRRRYGVPLPFRVSMRKNSRMAFVTYKGVEDVGQDGQEGNVGMASSSVLSEEMNMSLTDFYASSTLPATATPGAWKGKLKTGDKVYIDGIVFTILPSIGIKSKGGSRTSSRAGSRGDSRGGSRGGQRTARKKDDSGGDTGRDMSGGDTSRPTTSRPTTAASTTEEITLDHITLDRFWLLEDKSELTVHKLVPRVFYMKPVRALTTKALTLYPIQKIIAILAIQNYKKSRFYEYLSSQFDNDSGSYQMFQQWALKAQNKRDFYLRCSYRKVDMSFDFALRKSIGKVMWTGVSLLWGAVKIITNVVKSVSKGVEETPYEYWLRSLEKETVHVELDLDAAELVHLGDIVIDLKAPCEVMREYIHRNFREKLNETIGESFLFALVDPESNKMQILDREEEYSTFAKTYAVLKEDAKTFMSSLTVLLVKDRLRGRVFIPEFLKKVTDEEEGEENEDDDDDEEVQKLLNTSL